MEWNVTYNDYRNNFISKRSKVKEDLTKWVNSTFIIIMILIIFLFIYYLWTLNANATNGYSIRSLEKEIYQLNSKKDIIETKIANMKSLDSISKDDFSNKYIESAWKYDSLVIKEWVKYVFNN
jgi:cell division protein FtsB